ncbi:hypothetical protein [Kitasatospora phosalacinea]|uniref:hypothetical protein n=1 Tax=Kitasatospora phosalacinea TaxID=2065 RepID=UPI001F3E8F68|nr:hypothetical protein [Kitasatospora phosalacinea]
METWPTVVPLPVPVTPGCSSYWSSGAPLVASTITASREAAPASPSPVTVER